MYGSLVLPWRKKVTVYFTIMISLFVTLYLLTVTLYFTNLTLHLTVSTVYFSVFMYFLFQTSAHNFLSYFLL